MRNSNFINQWLLRTITFFLFLKAFFSFSETSITLIQKNSSDSLRAITASDLSWKLKDVNPDSSVFYAKKALTLSRKTGQQKIQAYSLSDIGNYYKRLELYDTALQFYRQSFKIRSSINSASDIASGYNQIGLLFKQQEKYDSAKTYFAQGIQVISKTEDTRLKLKIFDGYAMTLYHLGEFNDALLYLDSCYVLAEYIKDSLTIAHTIQNKGTINQYLGRNLTALKYYQAAEKHFESLNNINGIIDVSINMATVFIENGNYHLAINSLKKAEELSLNNGFEANLFSIYMNLGECFPKDLGISQMFYQKAFENAINNDKLNAQVKSGIALTRVHIKLRNLLKAENTINILDSLIVFIKPPTIRFAYLQTKSDFLAERKEYSEALKYSKNALILKDSISTQWNNLQDLSTKLEIERHEKKIALQALRVSETEKEIIEAKSSRENMLIWLMSIIILSLIIVIYLRRKWQSASHEKQIQQEKFNAKLKQQAYEANLFFLEESLKLETEIREKIGRDLHDELGSKLAVVQITLEGLINKKAQKKDTKETLLNVIVLVDQSCKNIRSIAHSLIENDTSNNSLSSAFIKHCQAISDSNHLDIDYSLTGQPYSLSREVKKHLHATTTLLIDNILQHSGADKASLQLFYHEDSVTLEIVDNGIGFNSKKKSGEGVGLKNAAKRITEINGTIHIDSQKDQGTYISITIPTNNE